MPYVNIRIAGTATREQKKELIVRVADLLYEVLDKPREATSVVIDELDPYSWGKGGKTIAEIWGLEE